MSDWQSYFDAGGSTLIENRKFIEEENRLNAMLHEIQESLTKNDISKVDDEFVSYLDKELATIKEKHDKIREKIDVSCEFNRKELELHLIAMERYFNAIRSQFVRLKNR